MGGWVAGMGRGGGSLGRGGAGGGGRPPGERVCAPENVECACVHRRVCTRAVRVYVQGGGGAPRVARAYNLRACLTSGMAVVRMHRAMKPRHTSPNRIFPILLCWPSSSMLGLLSRTSRMLKPMVEGYQGRRQGGQMGGPTRVVVQQ